MASTNLISLPQLFTELNLQLKKENYVKAIDICNKIRSKSPNDPDAIKIKCICLMREAKFDKALEICAKSNDLLFEKAYCYYKLQNLTAAIEVINAAPEPKNNDMLHLQAQVDFRLNNYERCITIYEDLLKKEKGDTTEILTNLLAAYAAAGKTEASLAKNVENSDSYEIAYNNACVLIAAGRYDEARTQLKAAEKLCRETLESEGCTPEEIENEVAVIMVQLAYVLQICDDPDKAMHFYRGVLQSKLANGAVNAVASNNIVVLRKDRDLFDSFKRLKSISPSDLSKLSSSQSEVVAFNRALVLCLMNKGDECREAVKELEALKGDSEKPILIRSALLLKEKRIDTCREMLKKHEGAGSITASLILAHTYVVQGEYTQAANIIASIESIRHCPGTVATLVALYQRAGETPNAIRVLEASVEYHSTTDPSSSAAIKVMEASAAFKLSIHKYQEAAAAYESLVSGSVQLDAETRLRALASLVIALSYFDPKSAERRAAALPPLVEVDINAENLEKSIPRAPRSKIAGIISKVADVEAKKKERKRAAQNPEKIARKRQKRKEIYLAKLREKEGLNPSIPLPKPDPERWIPRKQRSYAKRGRRGRNKFVGAQGSGSGAQKDALKLDVAARAAAKKLEGDKEEKKATVAIEKTTAAQRKSKKKKRR